ncbi:hypothetical protein tinsulaeT_02680 [Thalassotalea insulae]|uniref:Thiosulfate reductase n=1 Tax=Thalassotalea insulae TaxID=2056778 RepID=A0ABQ6GLP1_9GAMM|nr:cytochrome C oxidase subunit IV family protein [Thalassotalea insulae]GLX76928.1 hypothetical protein tinsulaeT_02680 [Thalassotalea insulae]
MLSAKSAVISWGILTILTVLSVLLGTYSGQKSLVIFLVLAMVFVKGQQITDIFMELKTAPKLWRRLLLSYVIIIPLVIFLVYVI